MCGFDFLDPFVLFCGVEVLALFALVVVWFGLNVNCAYVALYGHVTPEIAQLQAASPYSGETVEAFEAASQAARHRDAA
jgi:hypothetical protein